MIRISVEQTYVLQYQIVIGRTGTANYQGNQSCYPNLHFFKILNDQALPGRSCHPIRQQNRMIFTRNQGCRRSEEHTSELQSRENIVCRLLLEKKKRPDEQ